MVSIEKSQKKIGIFMWYNDKIREYAEINYKINKIYCDKHNFTLTKSDTILCSNREPHWERIPLLLQHFANYDYLIWIDSDAFFYIDSPSIENVINSHLDKLLIFSGDNDCNSEKKLTCQINSGFFIVKSCEKSKNILTRWLTDETLIKSSKLSKPIFGSNKWNDQGVLRIMYDENIEEIKDNSIIIPYRILQHFKKDDKLKEKIYELTDRPFVFHSTNGENMIFKNRVKHSKEYYSDILLDINKKYINSEIQISKDVIRDIVINCNQNMKMLVFGLGYDSELWYNITNKNTFFIENNRKYIELNKNIDINNIIYHDYKGINVQNSYKLTEKQVENFKIPTKILDLAPFDIILVDGPNGFDNNCPGRLLPIYWSSKLLSKKSTIIYIDDAIRKLEKMCINKYFLDKPKTYFSDRLGTIKIII